MKKYEPLCEPLDEFEIRLASQESFQQAEEIFFLHVPPACDICGASFENRRFTIDTPLPGKNSPWGCICTGCFFEHNLEIGWGKGQLYTHLKDGSWLLTAGNRE